MHNEALLLAEIWQTLLDQRDQTEEHTAEQGSCLYKFFDWNMWRRFSEFPEPHLFIVSLTDTHIQRAKKSAQYRHNMRPSTTIKLVLLNWQLAYHLLMTWQTSTNMPSLYFLCVFVFEKHVQKQSKREMYRETSKTHNAQLQWIWTIYRTPELSSSEWVDGLTNSQLQLNCTILSCWCMLM